MSGSRAPAEADVCPETGRGRLSYPRAEYLFKQAAAAHDPLKQGWTLHQQRRPVRPARQTSAQVTADADPVARRRTR